MPNLINICLSQQFDAEFEQHEGGVFVDFTGMTVAEANNLRGQFAAKDIRYLVLKNRIARRSFQKMDLDVVDPLRGPTGYAYGNTEQAIDAAKILKEVLKTNKKLRVKGAIFESTVLNAEEALGLAGLPDRPTMQSMLASALIAPARGLATSINAVLSGLARCVNEKIKKEGGGEGEA